MRSPEEVAREVRGECVPFGPYGYCATHDSPLGSAPTCLHVLHLTEVIRARDAEVRNKALQEAVADILAGGDPEDVWVAVWLQARIVKVGNDGA